MPQPFWQTPVQAVRQAARQSIRPVGAAAGGVVGVALAWCLLFELNRWLFAELALSDYVSWVFLPAALRLVAVLLFGLVGAAGLFVGALITQFSAATPDLSEALALASISALAPWVTVQVGLRWLGIPRDLRGMQLRQLGLIAAACAAVCALSHQLYLTPLTPLTRDWEPWDLWSGLPDLGPMFIGDLAGMLILGWLASRVLRRLPPQVPPT
jgi:hypothetical protein